MRKLLASLCLLIGAGLGKMYGQGELSGVISRKGSEEKIAAATVVLKECGLWTVADAQGRFTLTKIEYGTYSLQVQCLGYIGRTVTVTIGPKKRENLAIELEEDNLSLEVVHVVAERTQDASTSSYRIDRTALAHQQTLSLGDISSLLPGGKTANSTLMDDSRISIRGESSEKGNASFGTAIEIDGVRIDNNAAAGETAGASLRSIGMSDVESVEVVSGIPSVEYGDLSNGIVKVNVRKGRAPLAVEVSLNPHTRAVSASKGIPTSGGGAVNVSAERARSFSNIASPYTAYTRNNINIRYSNTFFKDGTPLYLEAGLGGNIGGYSSESDPDEVLDSYTKTRDNALRGNIALRLLLNKPWITNLSLSGSVSLQDKRSEVYSNASAASTQPYIHTMQSGYFVAQDYDANPQANIILGPTGYWYVRSYSDQKPVSVNLKLKGELSRRAGAARNSVQIGAEFKSSGNNGRGTYYQDMRYAPTWREYQYSNLPRINNLALFAEDDLSLDLGRGISAKLTAGLRDDITFISGSDYGTVSSLSPRTNLKVDFGTFSVHAGAGRSVKLPGFQVLYPSPSYTDILVFTPGSTVDNKSYYAYYTHATSARYNPNLKWQYTDQLDLGADADIRGTKISLSAYYHKTRNPYTSVNLYTPFTYLFTGQSAIEGSPILTENRRYSIDSKTGIVTLSDASGANPPVQLAANEHRTFNDSKMYVNGSDVHRYGLEWIVDFARIKKLRTSLRLDGNLYFYKGVDKLLYTYSSSSMGSNSPLLGHYRGGSGLSNGSESSKLNLNATFTTHIPELRLIVTLRIEGTLRNYKRSLSEGTSDAVRGIVLENGNDYFGQPYNKNMRDVLVAIYPEYYSTWENPDELIPFEEKFLWARENDASLYNRLARLVVKSTYAYTFNPARISEYFTANFSVTKEIGSHVSLSFYANNFFNSMRHVKNSQTGLYTSLFGSGYIPSYYYGLTLRIKI